MITVYYEMYWNDYRKRNNTDSFTSLSSLENWIFDQMQQNYTQNIYAMSFPTPEAARRINAEGPWAIEFSPTWEGQGISFTKSQAKSELFLLTGNLLPDKNIGVQRCKIG